MGQFLQILLNLIRDYLVIWRVVYQGQLGIRWTLGKHTKNLKPGFYFFCPIIQRIETSWACYQEVDTITQSFTTKDGMCVTISANVGYVIYNAAKYHTEVFNFESTIERKIRKVLFKVLHVLDYNEIRTSLPALAEVLRDEIHGASTNWGVRIVEVGMTDFVLAPAYRVLNEVPNFFLSNS